MAKKAWFPFASYLCMADCDASFFPPVQQYSDFIILSAVSLALHTSSIKHCTNNDGDIQVGDKFCVSDTTYATITWIVI